MSHEPIPGELQYLPGTVFLTCPDCGATTVIMNAEPPSHPYAVTYECGCGTAWRVTTAPGAGRARWARRFERHTMLTVDAPDHANGVWIPEGRSICATFPSERGFVIRPSATARFALCLHRALLIVYRADTTSR
jgi:predicted RNA-binding Zn-ribbon protein involved in translation (DUF1610 family)